MPECVLELKEILRGNSFVRLGRYDTFVYRFNSEQMQCKLHASDVLREIPTSGLP